MMPMASPGNTTGPTAAAVGVGTLLGLGPVGPVDAVAPDAGDAAGEGDAQLCASWRLN